MSLALEGARVLVTRPSGRAESLVSGLQALGAVPVLLPAMRIAPVEDFAELDAVLSTLDRYDWVVFTSVNGVESVADRMEALKVDAHSLSNKRIAVIGPSTADACETRFRKPDLMPPEYVSESLADSLGNVEGQRFLLLRADNARPNLRQILQERGASVEEVTAYRAIPSGEDLSLDQPVPDYITFTSAASARAVADTLRRLGLEFWLAESQLVCIGPITATAVEEMGCKVAAVAKSYTAEGLLKSLVELATRREGTHV